MVAFHNRTHWIFDLDNTLANSAIDFDAVRQALGLPLGKSILEEIDTRPAAEADHLLRHLAALERDFALTATPLEGVDEMLQALARRGARLGILTRNSRANALETLAVCGLADFFDAAHILGRDEAAPKPDPAGILRLLAAWNTTPQTAVMVGDFHYDLEAGRRAGVATIYYDAGHQDLWTAQADMRVQSHAELISLIQKGQC
jgi:HAD superfamily hydrolase (TIGR01509 family)